MDTRFEAILNSLPAKESRSRLEPHSELITEMRKRGHSYREITQVLKKACGLKVGTSTVNDFVLTRSKSKPMLSASAVSRTRATKKNKRALTDMYRDAEARESTRRPQKELEGIARTIKELKTDQRKIRARAESLVEQHDDAGPTKPSASVSAICAEPAVPLSLAPALPLPLRRHSRAEHRRVWHRFQSR